MQHILTQLIHQIKNLQLLKVVPGHVGGLAELWLWAWFNFRWTDWLGLFTQFDRCFNTDADPCVGESSGWTADQCCCCVNEPLKAPISVNFKVKLKHSPKALWIAEASRAAEFLRVFLLLQWSGVFVLTHPCRPPRSICVFHQWMRSNAALTPLQFVCEDFQEAKVLIRLLTSSCKCDW